MSTDASLPSDLAACQRELLHTRSVLAETAVTCEEQKTQIEKLQAELELFKRYLYGRRSERHVEDPGQGRLFEPPADGEPPAPELSEAAEEEITYRRRRPAPAIAGTRAGANCRSICRGKKSCWTCPRRSAGTAAQRWSAAAAAS
jgi:hypothetical protein